MFFFTFLLWAAFTVVGELLKPKPKFDAPQASSLGDFSMPTAEVGRVVPVVFGTCYIKGANVTWYGDLKVDPIIEHVKTGWFSSTDVTKGYRYSLGMQLSLCKGFTAWELQHGSGFAEIRFDDKKLTHVTTSQVGTTYDDKFTRVVINEPNLFGGDEKEGGIRGTIDFFNGQSQQVQSDYLQSKFGTTHIPAYRGVCHAVFRQVYLGTSSYIKSVGIVVKRFPWLWDDSGSTTDGPWNINGDANPVAAIADAMTNAEWGLGVPLTNIGESFKVAALQCYNEGLGISMLWDTASNANDMLGDILRHIDGVIYTDPATGLYEISLARANYAPADLPVFDESSILTFDMSRPSWDETTNVVKVKYVDRAADYTQNTIERKNLANIMARGGVVSEDSFDFHGLSTSASAGVVADRVLKTISYPLAKIHFTVNREAWSLRPGSVFMLNWAELGISGMACRVTRISYGDMTSPEIEVDAVEDVFGLLDTTFSTPPSTGWTDPNLPVAVNTASRIVEAPYHFIGAEERRVMTMGVRSSYSTLGYKVMQTINGTLTETQSVPAFTPSGKLQSALSRTGAMTAASLVVYGCTDAASLSSINSNELAAGMNMLLIDDELMTWQTIADNGDGTYTISGINRAVVDTLASDHAADSRVFFVSNGMGLTQQGAYPTDGTVSAKLVPYNGSQQLDSSSVPNVSVTTASRASKPNPPGRVRYNNVEFPATTVGDVSMTWAHRNKSYMQTNGVVPSQADASAGAIDGTYTVTVYVGGVVKRTFSSLTGTTQAYTAAQRAADNTDGTQPVVFKIKGVNASSLSSVERVSEPVIMTGLGMTLGQYLGGFSS